MSMPKTLRTFIALPLSKTMIDQLAAVQRTLRRTCPERAIRWVAPENIHLTLFFLGDILPERVPPVQQALSVVTRYVQPFTFTVQGAGAFPDLNRPRVVWLGLDEPTGRLVLLHQAINEAIEKVGFQPEARRFSPHLTLGRIQRKASRDEARAVGQAVAQASIGCLGEVRAEEIIFFRSVLKSSGAEYTPLETFRFKGTES